MNPDPSSALVARYLAAAPDPADLPFLLQQGLGGELLSRLPADHPLTQTLRPQARALAARHLVLGAELRPLFAAWAREGMVPLLLKGFALARFVYRQAAGRPHGDVDLWLPGEAALVARAAHLAMARGWHSDGQHADPRTWTHESAHLRFPGGESRIDLHRFLLHSVTLGERRARRATGLLLEHTAQHDWDGLTVRLLSPDAALLHLALGRLWPGETAGLKLSDYRDHAELLRAGASHAGARALARELGAAHTWELFLRHCDPTRGVFVPAGPSWRRDIPAALRRDGVSLSGATVVRQLSRLPGLLGAAPWAVPLVLGAVRSVQRREPPLAALSRRSGAGFRRLPLFTRQRTVLHCSWWVRLLLPRAARQGVCVVRAYAVYAALRRAGHPAVFLSGVNRTDAGHGHAWVEDDLGALEEYGEPLNRARFAVLLRYPPGDTSSQRDTA